MTPNSNDTLVVDEVLLPLQQQQNLLLDNDTDVDGPNPISMQLVAKHDFKFCLVRTGTFTMYAVRKPQR